MKIIVYADTVRQARNFYSGTSSEQVGHRAACDFDKPEKCDLVKYAKPYPDIEKAYDKPKKKNKK